jgi:hypothetical protein
MANGTRTLTLILVLIVGAVAGWFIGRGKPAPAQKTYQKSECPTNIPAPVPPQPWKLFVESDSFGNPCKVTDGNGVERPVVVIKSGDPTHVIQFAPKDSDGKHRLAITIHVPPGSPPPFRNLTFGGVDENGHSKMLLVCDDATKPCLTGPTTKHEKACYYKYDQTLDNKTCDAGIIIQP